MGKEEGGKCFLILGFELENGGQNREHLCDKWACLTGVNVSAGIDWERNSVEKLGVIINGHFEASTQFGYCSVPNKDKKLRLGDFCFFFLGEPDLKSILGEHKEVWWYVPGVSLI